MSFNKFFPKWLRFYYASSYQYFTASLLRKKIIAAFYGTTLNIY